MPRDEDGIFCLKVEFEHGTPDPSRVFRTITQLISAFSEFDHELAESVGTDITTTLLLEDIEAGSLKAWLRNAVESVDDAAIKELSWKKAVGSYLVKAKRATLRVLADKQTISERKEVTEVQNELLQLAEATHIAAFPHYQPVAPERILRLVRDVSSATGQLGPNDTAAYESDDGSVHINKAFAISAEAVETLLTRETVASESTMILKVKKPDYLGVSQWELRHGEHPITASVADIEWLRSFQDRERDVRPGDSIRARVRTEIKYGFSNEVVAMHYTVLEVIAILPFNPRPQYNLLPPDRSGSTPI